MENMSVILIDDNAALIKAMSDDFSARSDVNLLGTADNGVDALDLIDQLQPQFVVLDIVMPRLDGLGVLRELNRRESRPHVVMLSALKNDAVVNRTVELGASYFMVKPATPAQVYEQLRTLAQDGPLPAPAPLAVDPPSTYARWSPD